MIDDLKYYSSKIINKWIINLVFQALQLCFYVILAFGIIGSGLILLAITKGAFSFKVYIAFVIILLIAVIIIFCWLVNIPLKTLQNLKRFCNNNAHGFMRYNKFDKILNELELTCKIIVKQSEDIVEVGSVVNKFKQLIFINKED